MTDRQFQDAMHDSDVNGCAARDGPTESEVELPGMGDIEQMRRERRGEFDNHHNAAKCPYCTQNGRYVMVETTEFAALTAHVRRLEDGIRATIKEELNYYWVASAIRRLAALLPQEKSDEAAN